MRHIRRIGKTNHDQLNPLFPFGGEKPSRWKEFDKVCEAAWNALGNNFGRLTMLGLAVVGAGFIFFHLVK